jgi:hypothetical protein
MRCYEMLCDAMRCYVMLCDDVRLCAIMCDAVRCCVMLCDAVRCCAMLCDAVRRCATLCDAVRREKRKRQIVGGFVGNDMAVHHTRMKTTRMSTVITSITAVFGSYHRFL